jgi:hypothetical protein
MILCSVAGSDGSRKMMLRAALPSQMTANRIPRQERTSLRGVENPRQIRPSLAEA